MNELLKKLNIKDFNYGSCSGPGGWIENSDSKVIKSHNPSTGELISSVYEASVEDYNVIIDKSVAAFHEWRVHEHLGLQAMPSAKRWSLPSTVLEQCPSAEIRLGGYPYCSQYMH